MVMELQLMELWWVFGVMGEAGIVLLALVSEY